MKSTFCLGIAEGSGGGGGGKRENKHKMELLSGENAAETKIDLGAFLE